MSAVGGPLLSGLVLRRALGQQRERDGAANNCSLEANRGRTVLQAVTRGRLEGAGAGHRGGMGEMGEMREGHWPGQGAQQVPRIKTDPAGTRGQWTVGSGQWDVSPGIKFSLHSLFANCLPHPAVLLLQRPRCPQGPKGPPKSPKF